MSFLLERVPGDLPPCTLISRMGRAVMTINLQLLRPLREAWREPKGYSIGTDAMAMTRDSFSRFVSVGFS